MQNLWAVVLAAGEGKRMHSRLPKVLHPLCGKMMLNYVLESAAALTTQVLVVVGHGALQVREAAGEKWDYVLQEEQLGTGHAVMEALKKLPKRGTVLILCGDTPLLEEGYLRQLLAQSVKKAVAVATTIMPDPTGYGRIVRDQNGQVERIVEDKDASVEEKEINEINTGIYCFDLNKLRDYLPRLNTDNIQKEYYLPDVIAMMYRDSQGVGSYCIEDYRVGLGINNRVQLAEAVKLLQKSINRSLMLNGVTVVDPDSTYIDCDVQIGPDTVLMPNTVIEGGTVVGKACRIGPGSHLVKAVVKDQAVVRHAVVSDSTIERGSLVGPFTWVCPEQRKQ